MNRIEHIKSHVKLITSVKEIKFIHNEKNYFHLDNNDKEIVKKALISYYDNLIKEAEEIEKPNWYIETNK